MKLTLLLDLDDTLLDTNLDELIPAYFQALSRFLQEIVSPDVMIPALMGGTKRMMDNIDPGRLLSDVFDDYFYSKIDVNQTLLRKKIDQFYNDVFPELSQLTKQNQEAIDFVKWAFLENYKIVIATNPLFPIKAIHHRLRWAGLAPENYPYALITSYKNSHFTKENISYFPEILGKLGWEDGQVLMVGNDLKSDIGPAMAAGLPVFWVNDGFPENSETKNIPQGRISEVRSWLKDTPADALLHSTQKPSALVATLRSIPAVLLGFFGDLERDELDIRFDCDDWSIKEVVCHLRDVEIEVNLPRIKKILSEDNSFVSGVLTDPWVKERNYAGQNGMDALDKFLKARNETVNLLVDLRTEWNRPVRHSIFGSSNLSEMVGVMVGHDKAHIQQIYKIRDQLGKLQFNASL